MWTLRVWQQLRRKWTDLDEILNSVSEMWGMALADFGRDLRSSDSLRSIVFPKKCSQNFQVLQLQDVITPQWLQIARNSLPNCLCTGCLIIIFTIRINTKGILSLDCTLCTRKVPTQILCNRWQSPCRGRPAESWCKSKQTNVGVTAVRRCISK